MKKYIFAFVLFYFFVSTLITAQVEKTLVTTDGYNITEPEFRKQFELSPMVYNTSDTEEKKRTFLISMAAEKLWAMEAETMSPYSSPLIKYSLSEIEKKFMRDVLYNEEIEAKVKITPSELEEAKRKYKQKLKVLFITSTTEETISNAYQKLKTGTPVDSLSYFVKGLSQNVMEIGYGDMFENYENILFQLNPGEYSQPLLTEAGYTIFYLINKSVDIEKASLPSDRLASSARSMLEKHKIKAIYQEFNKNFLGNVKVNADIKLFNIISEKISSVASAKKTDDTSGVSLSFYDIFGISASLSKKELESPFIKFEKNPVSLRDFLGSIGFEGLKLPDENLNTLKSVLNGWIKNYIRLELLSREAENRGFKAHPEVVSEMRMWKDNYFATYAVRKYTENIEVTEAEVSQYVSDTTGEGFSGLYKIFGLETSSIEKINILLEAVDQNKNFVSAVKKLKSGSDEYIDYDYVPLHETNEISGLVGEMKTGDVYGPLETSNRYSIFQLVDIKKMEESVNTESFRRGAKSRLYNKKLEQMLEERTVELAKKYNLDVNTSLLEGIQVNDINIVVMRSYGFGEKMLAAPMIQRNIKWYKSYLEEKSESL